MQMHSSDPIKAGPAEQSPVPRTNKHRFASREDVVACRGLIRTGSKSFYAASLLLPRAMRDPAYAVYAFCRLADDEVDLTDDPKAGLKRLRARLAAVYEGTPWDIAADRALADTARDFGIPKSLFDALLEGFEWDVDGKRYDTLDDLYGYAARVAGTVGAIMTLLMGRRGAGTLARACDLGVAMQLTNIARDVGEDAREGRIYLPLSWLREVGIAPEDFLADPSHSDALGKVIARLLDVAEDLYGRSAPGVAELPFGCRPAINAARKIYAEIGRQVARQGHDSVSRRAVVSSRRKLGLLLEAAVEAPILGTALHDPALPETAFLVDAATNAATGRKQTAHGQNANGALDESVGWVMDLFMELDRRDKEARRAFVAEQMSKGRTVLN